MDLKQTLLNLPTSRLKRAVAIKQRIEALEKQLQRLLEVAAPAPVALEMPARRRMSAAGKARIAKAARERWAKWRASRKKVK
jgi:hypothetical protein